MGKLFLTFFMTLFSVGLTYGQVNFGGKVETEANGKKESVGFTAVVLTPATDSLATVSSITDMNGDFSFEKLPAGTYRISISCLGYKTLEQNVVLPESETTIMGRYLIEQEVYQVDQVTVTASTRIRDIDKVTYVITGEQRKNSVHGIDLLGVVPQLSFDENSQRIRSGQGGNVKILVNGANATEQELLSLNAADIKSIEFYDFPPARYAGYSNVVNVQTRYIDDGLYGGVNLQHAFTTGFANDGLFFRYNWGVNQLSLNVSTNYRNYNNFDSWNRYAFSLGDKKYDREESQARKFGYDDNYISLNYTRNVEDKYLLQVKFDPNFQHTHTDATSDVVQMMDNTRQDRDATFGQRTSQFTPSLDIYTSINLPKGQELTFNALGTYHDANLNYSRIEKDKDDGAVSLQDVMNQDNSKKSIIGEAYYALPTGIGTLSFGDNISYGRLNSTIKNSLSSGEYFNDVTTNLIYAELSSARKKLQYRFSLGGYYYGSVNNELSYDSWTFKPYVLLRYQVSNRFSITGDYGRETSDPTLSQLSRNKTLISENIIREGNPALKHSVKDFSDLLLSLSFKPILFNAMLTYQREKLPINSYFFQAEDYMMSLRYENAKLSEKFGLSYSVLINPFKNSLFMLRLNGKAEQMRIESSFGSYKHFQYPLTYEVTTNYKHFSLSYQGNIIGWNLSGPYLNSDEKVSTLRLRYIHKKWTFTAMCMWLLSDAKYKTRTIDGSLVNYSFQNNIRDNKSMFTLGVSYRFNVGRKVDEAQRRINNSDRDSGLFQ